MRGAAALGLLGVALGIARLALLGWLLPRVFASDDLRALALPIAAVAIVTVARAVLE